MTNQNRFAQIADYLSAGGLKTDIGEVVSDTGLPDHRDLKVYMGKLVATIRTRGSAFEIEINYGTAYSSMYPPNDVLAGRKNSPEIGTPAWVVETIIAINENRDTLQTGIEEKVFATDPEWRHYNSRHEFDAACSTHRILDFCKLNRIREIDAEIEKLQNEKRMLCRGTAGSH